MIIISSISDLSALKELNPTSIILSKTEVGFGSPQVVSLAHSLADFTQKNVLICAPLRKDAVPTTLAACGYSHENVTLIYIDFRDCQTFFEENQKYIALSRHILSLLQPKVVCVMHPTLLNGLPDIGYRPSLTALYLLEMPLTPEEAIIYGTDYFSDWFDVTPEGLNILDLAIFPEENRQRIETARLGIDTKHVDTIILYNSRIFPWSLPITAPSQRTKSFFYGGGIRKNQTCGGWFLEPEVQKFPIDMYGWLREFDDPDVAIAAFNNHPYKQHYFGKLPSDSAYFALLAKHAYALVIWAPILENTTYAAPNKMFDSLACDVPIISGPTPLAVKLVEKYNCGIILPDWELKSFTQALCHAETIFGTAEYDAMFEGCRRAMADECDWNVQCHKKLLPIIKQALTR